MQPPSLSHTRLYVQNTHTQSHFPPIHTPAASVIVLACTSFVGYTSCLWGRSVCVERRQAESYNQIPAADFTALLRRAQDVGSTVKPWCVCGEWMAVALSWRHLDSLDTYREVMDAGQWIAGKTVHLILKGSMLCGLRRWQQSLTLVVFSSNVLRTITDSRLLIWKCWNY